jgi:hypothetical protein
MKSGLLLLLFAPALAIAAMACGGSGYGEDDDSSPTPVVSVGSPTVAVPTPEPTVPTSTPLGEIIAAAEANDIETLRRLLVFTPTPCATNVQGAGGPPDCRPGEPDGTLVPVLAIADCEGHYVREDEVALDPLATGTITFFNAYNAPAGFFPEGERVLLFRRQQAGIGEIGMQLILTDESISGIRYGCGITAEDMIELHGLGDPIDIGTAGT